MEAFPTYFAIELGTAAEASPPTMPPYTEDDNPLDGVACYIIGCKYKGYDWAIFLQQLRLKHQISFASIEGSYLHTQGKD
jgi:hypothetical protein